MVQAIRDLAHPVQSPLQRGGERSVRVGERIPRATDALELSESAQQRVDDAASANANASRIARLREEIAAGTYLTPARIEATVQRLQEKLSEH